MKVWIHNSMITISLTILLTGCEYFLSEPTPPIDYSGLKDSIVDIDGNVYKTIGIGTQIWMAENLRTSKLNDGTIIPHIKNDMAWDTVFSPAYCYYNNDSTTYWKNYGALYNFHVVNTDKLCPDGWRVPNNKDWDILSSFLGGDYKSAGRLKQFFGPFWNDPNPCFSNNTGFNALPGGLRRKGYNGGFFKIKDEGYWWSNSYQNEFTAAYKTMFYSSTFLGSGERSRTYGYSVRCLKEN